jgi:hypothetical protein
MQYAIHEAFFPDVERKLNRIAKKCQKHGNDFIFEVVGEEFLTKSVDGVEEVHKFILVEVEGTAKIDAWECIAVMEVTHEGNIIRRINTDVEVPEHFRTSDNICEHCNTKRDRNQLYIVHNVDTDEWKQVGGSCLKLYTDGLNMEYVVAFMDGITELEEVAGTVAHGKCYYSVRDVIGRAYEIISKTGYFSAESTLPTKSLVSWLMFRSLERAVEGINKDLECARFTVSFAPKDFYKKETEVAVDNIINHYMNLEDDSEFVHNVKTMISSEYVSSKNFGFLSFLPEGYNRAIQKEIERVAREELRKNEKSEHFGEVGNRYKDVDIQSVTLLTYWENQFGNTYIYKIVTADNFVLTWKTGNGLYLYDNEKFSKITFTVKAHSEYRGQNQTEITRAKVLVAKC